MTPTQKVVLSIGYFCGIFYLVTGLLNILEVLNFPKAVLYPVWGIFWLCSGYLQKIRTYSIFFYIFAGVCFPMGVLWLF